MPCTAQQLSEASSLDTLSAQTHLEYGILTIVSPSHVLVNRECYYQMTSRIITLHAHAFESRLSRCVICNAAEQKARVTYDNILRLSDDPDVNDVIKFLREREIVHFQRFGEAIQLLRERLNQKNVYCMNPSFDK